MRNATLQHHARTDDDFDADFALGGEVEFEETDQSDLDGEIDLLVVRVQAARDAGA